MTRTHIAAALVVVVAVGLLVKLGPFGADSAGPSADGAARRAEATRVGAEDTAALETPATDLEGVRSPASAPVEDRPPVRPTESVAAARIDSEARLVVRVVDPAGRPVPGVRIEWVTVDRRGVYDEWSIAPASDENGLVEVPGAGRFLDPLFHQESADARWRVRVARAGLRTELPFDGRLPSADEPAPGVLWFDEEPRRGRPVVIVLPPVGALRVTWETAQRGDGAALTPDALVVQRIGAGAGGEVHRWRVSERL